MIYQQAAGAIEIKDMDDKDKHFIYLFIKKLRCDRGARIK
jgi:hypothetical protein